MKITDFFYKLPQVTTLLNNYMLYLLYIYGNSWLHVVTCVELLYFNLNNGYLSTITECTNRM